MPRGFEKTAKGEMKPAQLNLFDAAEYLDPEKRAATESDDDRPGVDATLDGIARTRTATLARQAFLSLWECWVLSDREAAALLACSIADLYRLRESTAPDALSADQINRISALVSIYQRLHMLFVDTENADRWMRRPNTGPLFNGQTPIEAMARGGIQLMNDVRAHVRGARAGL